MKRILAAGSSILLVTAAWAAHAEQRQLGPHDHGHGTLNIAIEGNSVEMELEVPGADIVGFEHEATTPEQKAQIETAETKLKDALKQFVLPSAASCKVTKANVGIEAEAEHEHEHNHDKGKDAHEDHAHDADGHKDEHEDHDHEGGGHHNEFKVTYALECADTDQIGAIHFAYFKSFPNARALSVTVVSEKRQGSYEVTAASPDLDLSGSM